MSHIMLLDYTYFGKRCAQSGCFVLGLGIRNWTKTMQLIILLFTLSWDYFVSIFMFYSYSYTSASSNTFISHFNAVSWVSLSDDEKKDHQFLNCTRCRTHEHKEIYMQLRKNKVISSEINQDDSISAIAKTSTSQADYKEKIMAAANLQSEAIWGTSVLTDKLNTIDNTKKAESALLKKAAAAVREYTTAETNLAIRRNNQSYNQVSNSRRDITLETTDQTKRKRTGINLDIYQFNRDAVRAEIEQIIESGAEKVNFSQLARQQPVMKLDGKQASNANQILKAFAIHEGLMIDDGVTRERRAKRKLNIEGHEINLSDFFPTLDALNQDTKDRIASGEWDIGTPIVPVTVRVKTINDKGEVETKTNQLYGRAYSLQQIMDKTLQNLEELSLLRPLYSPDSNIEEVKLELKRIGKLVV